MLRFSIQIGMFINIHFFVEDRNITVAIRFLTWEFACRWYNLDSSVVSSKICFFLVQQRLWYLMCKKKKRPCRDPSRPTKSEWAGHCPSVKRKFTEIRTMCRKRKRTNIIFRQKSLHFCLGSSSDGGRKEGTQTLSVALLVGRVCSNAEDVCTPHAHPTHTHARPHPQASRHAQVARAFSDDVRCLEDLCRRRFSRFV